MDDVPYFHAKPSVACNLTLVKAGAPSAAGNRGRRWNPSQNQVCDVGFVFPCGSLGVLWPQPDLLRHSGRKWRKERATYGSSCQFQTSKVAVEIDGRTSGAGSDRAPVPRSASRVPGCRTGNTSRRTRRTPLDGLRFQQPGLRHPTFLLFLLLANSWTYRIDLPMPEKTHRCSYRIHCCIRLSLELFRPRLTPTSWHIRSGRGADIVMQSSDPPSCIR
jgi:hypothetical protein